MPIVRIDLWEGRSFETKEKLVVEVSKAVSKSLEISPEKVMVVLQESPKENWGIMGKPAHKLDEEKHTE